MKCQIPNSTFVFDIVCAFEYRLYSYFINLNTNYIEGNIIYDQFDNRIINFPKQSYKNSVAKNKNCDGKYKKTVRIIKNIMKNEIIENNWIPSFALESLLYNVSNEYFTYNDKAFRCSKIIEQTKKIINNNWDYLVESNQLLFIKNINNVTQQKCLMLLNEIDTLLSKHIIQDLTNVNNNFKTY